ncbi:DUF885 domain-containing protein [Sphingomonas sp. S2-65]|uniref:DUF885 domain-containing protein n=1 Tax=Sphingomonas sp. S2-65 TaxID=2903960 RepID=UPI001F2BA97F|nr:DUF885 domain-containing protein [Sphingomonas sp. S2-65]UYY59388.1 DUF885 domain-containing protein [Sphingomonas sp. S2-65]
MKRVTLACLLAAGAVAPLMAHAQAGTQAPGAASQTAEDQRLLTFLDAAFDEAVALSPEQMTSLGLKTKQDRLDDYTDAAEARRLALAERQLAEMKRQFSPDRLSVTGRLSYRLFEKNVETARRQYQFRQYSFPVSTNGSPAGDIPVFLINEHRIDTVEDARAYVARLVDSERVMGEVSARMREQARQGIVPPKMVFAPARGDAQKVISGAPFDGGPDSTILADFRKKVSALKADDATKKQLIEQAKAALTGPFKRGFATLFAALDAIEPQAKGNDGAWSLPGGDAYYQSQLAFYTTTNLSADQIHQTGLAQVKAIRAEMERVKAQIGFKGSLEAFFDAIRTDPAYKYPNDEAGREQYLSDARAVIARMMATGPRFFHRLPEAKLEVRAVEKWRQETASVAFYNRPAPDGSRPGIFYVNLADMNQVNKQQVNAIAVHEGAPGHHFQIARAQELQGLPKFRRFGFYGSYIEGWGLYTERLAQEMGAYPTPDTEFGMLSLQIWRAIRMVVDTGMHAKHWSREQAVAFFQKNSPLSQRDIVKEVDRYINNPGQATSYMVGQLKIAGLRVKAQKALGSRFDIRDFHEAVLANGALPLDVLEEQVDAYIAAKRG